MRNLGATFGGQCPPYPMPTRIRPRHMIVDRRRILGGFAVFALVVLRLVIGWHFFGEGTKKLQYNSADRAFHLAFSADKELLDKAKGPLAEWYLAFVPGGH